MHLEQEMQPSYASLDKKVAMVTGGASGLGAGFVKRFVVEGARVVVIAVDGEDIPGL